MYSLQGRHIVSLDDLIFEMKSLMVLVLFKGNRTFLLFFSKLRLWQLYQQ